MEANYPLLSIFWTILWIYFIFALLFVLFRVIVDIFQNKKMGGFAKAVWLVVIILIPIIGVLVYLIANGDEMAARSVEARQAQDDQFRQYVQNAAGSPGTGDQLAQLTTLRDQGALTEAEFASAKAKLLA